MAIGAVTLLPVLAGPASAARVSAVDDQARRVTLAEPARRVVSLAPNVTEMLFAVGAGPAVVGVTQFCDFPPAARRVKKIGNFSAPDLEAVAAARPDLVVAAYGNSLEAIAALRRMGLPVFVTNPQDTGGVLRNLAALGTLTGHPAEAARRIQEFRDRLGRLKRRLAGRPARRTLVVVWTDPMTVVGARSFVNEAIRRAGGVNAAGEIIEAYPKLDPERLITLRPEVILYPTGDAHATTAELARRPGVAETPAGQARQIYTVTADWVVRAGPRLIAGIEEMARRLHPEAFGNVGKPLGEQGLRAFGIRTSPGVRRFQPTDFLCELRTMRSRRQ
jgi:ABC-type Fe3+-hydroxamate transport system substrate-binding protein